MSFAEAGITATGRRSRTISVRARRRSFREKSSRIAVHDFASGDTFTAPGDKDFPFGHLHIDGSLELAI